jgi:hypothetical protein
VALVARALERNIPVLVPAGVVAQVWRDGRRQSRLARLLGSPLCSVISFDDVAARAAGQLCGVAGTRDVVDATVVLLAREYDGPVVTSDAADLQRLDRRVRCIEV